MKLPAALPLPVAVTCALTGTLFAAALRPARADDTKAVTLKLAPKEGAAHRYRNTSHIESPGLNGATVEETSVLKVTATKVAADGTATFEQEYESRKAMMNGSELPGPDVSSLPRITTTLDRTGKVLSYKVSNPPPGGGKLQEALTYVASLNLPDKAVKPGETWTVEVDNRLVPGKKVKSEFTYLGTEKVGDRDANKIRHTFEMDTTGAPMKGDLTFYLDPVTGDRLKETGTLTDFPVPTLGTATITLDQMQITGDQEQKKPTDNQPPAQTPPPQDGK